MQKLIEIIKGSFIGIANVIPGLSGGTIAIILKIYDKLINAISDVFKHPIVVIKSLLFILIGLVLGIVLAVLGVTYFYEKYPVPTAFLFLGFILGGIPFLLKEINLKKINIRKGLIFLFFLGATAIFPFLSGSVKNIEQLSFVNFMILFGLGVISSATMVIPGVSGSMVLMCLGYYESIMNLAKECLVDFMNFEMGLFFENLLLVLPFAIGIVLGIVVIAKIIKLLLIKARELTFYAIMGLILATPVSIIYNIKSFQVDFVEIIFTIILFGLGITIPYLIENKMMKKFNNKNALEERKEV